jgi:outer membrane protein OmpA-like peptidoglycan-associated protein
MSNPQTYSIYFQSFSTTLDPEARQTVQDAAAFAQSHGWLTVQVAGYAAPVPTKQDLDALSAERADAVKHLLVEDGIAANRIVVEANGAIDPKPLPSLSVRRVDISFGPTPTTKSTVAAPGFR